MSNQNNADAEAYDKEHDAFMKQLEEFHQQRGTPFKRLPRVNGKAIDLYLLYVVVTARGGWQKVNSRCEWEEILEDFRLPPACVNSSSALKTIYIRYLDSYERIHFLGEDGDDRGNDGDDDESRTSMRVRKSVRALNSVPLSYNQSQHNVPESARAYAGLSTELYKDSSYDNLTLSLLGPLPNEHDFAFNMCTLLSNEGKHTLQLSQCPRIVEHMLAHTGVFKDRPTQRYFISNYKDSKGKSLLQFWLDSIENKSILDLLSPDDLELHDVEEEEEDEDWNEDPPDEDIDEKHLNSKIIEEKVSLESSTNKDDGSDSRKLLEEGDEDSRSEDERGAEKESTSKLRRINFNANNKPKWQEVLSCELVDVDVDGSNLFHLGRDLCLMDSEGTRVSQVLHIVRNLSFEECNVPILAQSRTLIRYLILCISSRWGGLSIGALDTLGNIATEIRLLEPKFDRMTSVLLSEICKGISSQDRAFVLRSLEVLNKLSLNECNEDTLSRNISQEVYNQVCRYLCIHDIMLLIYTLEALFALSSIGSSACNAIVRAVGSIQTLVSLLTVEAQSYGPDACIGMKVVETVTGVVNENESGVQTSVQQSSTTTSTTDTASAAAATTVTTLAVSSLPSTSITTLSSTTAPAQTTVVARTITGTPRPPIAPNRMTPIQQKLALKAALDPSKMTPIRGFSVPPEVEQFVIEWVKGNYDGCATNAIEQAIVYRHFAASMHALNRKQGLNPVLLSNCVRKVFGTNVGPSKRAVEDGSEKLHYLGIKRKESTIPTLKSLTATPIMPSPPIRVIATNTSATATPPRQSIKIPLTVARATENKLSGSILKAQLSAPLKGPASSIKVGKSPPPPYLQGTSIQPPVPRSDNSTLIKSLLANKVISGGNYVPTPTPIGQPPSYTIVTNTAATSKQSVCKPPPSSISYPAQQNVQLPSFSNIAPPFANKSSQMSMSALSKGIHPSMPSNHPPSPISSASVSTAQSSQQYLPLNSHIVHPPHITITQQTASGQVIERTHIPRITSPHALAGSSVPLSSSPVSTGGSISPKVAFSARSPINLNPTHPQPASITPIHSNTVVSPNYATQLQRSTAPHTTISSPHSYSPSPVPSLSIIPSNVAVTSLNQSFTNAPIHSPIASRISPDITVTRSPRPNMTSQQSPQYPSPQHYPISQMSVVSSPELATGYPMALSTVQSAPVSVVNVRGTPSTSSVAMEGSCGAPNLSRLMQVNRSIQKQILPSEVNQDSNSTTQEKISLNGVLNELKPDIDLIQDRKVTSFEGILQNGLKEENDIKAEEKVKNPQFWEGHEKKNLLADLLEKTVGGDILNGVVERELKLTEKGVQIVNHNQVSQSTNIPIQHVGPVVNQMVRVNQVRPPNSIMQRTLVQPQVVNSVASMNGEVPSSPKRSSTQPVVIQTGVKRSGTPDTLPATKRMAVDNPDSRITLYVSQNGTEGEVISQGHQVVLNEGSQIVVNQNNQQVVLNQGSQAVASQGNQVIGTHPTTGHQVIFHRPSQGNVVLQHPQTQIVRYPNQQVVTSTTPPQAVGHTIISQPANSVPGQMQILTTGQGMQKVILHGGQIGQLLGGQVIIPVSSSSAGQGIVVQGGNSLQPGQVIVQGSAIGGQQGQVILQGAGGNNQVYVQQAQNSQGQQFFIQSVNSANTNQPSQLLQNQVIMNTSSGQAVMVGGQGQMVVQGGVNSVGNTVFLAPQQNSQHVSPQSQPQKTLVFLPNQQTTVGQVVTSRQHITTTAHQQASNPAVSTVASPRVSVVSQSQNPAIQSKIVQVTSTTSGMTTAASFSNATSVPGVAPLPSGPKATPVVALPPHHIPTPKILSSGVARRKPTGLRYLCEWRGCKQIFSTPGAVYHHCCQVHCPATVAEVQCGWAGCDPMVRRRFSAMTHLHDRHCNEQLLQVLAVRRHQLGTSGKTDIPIPQTPPPHPGYAPNAAFHAIKRHSLEVQTQRDLVEKEGPVTKSIRLTSALILRNLVIYSTMGKSLLRGYESELANVAISNMESSRTVAQILYDIQLHELPKIQSPTALFS